MQEAGGLEVDGTQPIEVRRAVDTVAGVGLFEPGHDGLDLRRDEIHGTSGRRWVRPHPTPRT